MLPADSPGIFSKRAANARATTAGSRGGGRRLFGLALPVVLCASGAIVWFSGAKHEFLPKRFGVVVRGKLFRSGQIRASILEDVICRHGIREIIDLNGIEPTLPGQEEEIALAGRLGVALHRFPLAGDGSGPIMQYGKALSVIDRCLRARRPVLIHCAAGSQRTGVAIAFYRLLVECAPPGRVYAEMLQFGWDESQNGQMLPYINGHIRRMADHLSMLRIIDRPPDPLPVLRP